MLISIQYLRVVAASMVVIFHAVGTAGAHAAMPSVLLSGAAGVDIFFVISGFIMWQSTARAKIAPGEFLRKRLARIAPFYWLMTMVMCAAPFISGTLARGIIPDIGHTFASFAFIPWHSVRDDPGVFFPVYTPGWTLNFEMFFYVVFAAALWIADWRWRIVASIAALLAIVSIGFAMPEHSAAAWTMSPIILEFAGGLCIGVWAGRQRRLSAPLAAAMLIAGFIALAATPAAGWVGFERVLRWGVPAMFIVLGAVELEQHRLVPRWPAMLLAGDASYALYLTHLLVLGVCAIAWHGLNLWTSTAGLLGFFVVVFGTSQIVGILAHLYVERPLSMAAATLLSQRNIVAPAPL